MGNDIERWVRYCANEVERQGRGPAQVADMFEAFMYARHVAFLYGVKQDGDDNRPELLRFGLRGLEDIEMIAYYVEKTANVNAVTGQRNWRTTPVTRGFLGPVIGSKPEHIDRQMQLWFSDLVEDAWYIRHTLDLRAEWPEDIVDRKIKGLLDIHPWRDGNGRTASILRNMMLRKLDDPEPLPYYYTTPCTACEGSGTVMGTDPCDPEYVVPVPCDACNGDGFIEKG